MPRPPRTWEQNYNALLRFKKKFKTTSVPFTYKEDRQLAKWVYENRLNQATLTPSQRAKLDGAGFDFQLMKERNEAAWDEKLESLKEFAKKFGTCVVPNSYIVINGAGDEDLYLGRWCAKQRSRNARGLLDDERFEKLDEMGFTWDLNDRALYDARTRKYFGIKKNNKKIKSDRNSTTTTTKVSASTDPRAVAKIGIAKRILVNDSTANTPSPTKKMLTPKCKTNMTTESVSKAVAVATKKEPTDANKKKRPPPPLPPQPQPPSPESTGTRKSSRRKKPKIMTGFVTGDYHHDYYAQLQEEKKDEEAKIPSEALPEATQVKVGDVNEPLVLDTKLPHAEKLEGQGISDSIPEKVAAIDGTVPTTTKKIPETVADNNHGEKTTNEPALSLTNKNTGVAFPPTNNNDESAIATNNEDKPTNCENTPSNQDKPIISVSSKDYKEEEEAFSDNNWPDPPRQLFDNSDGEEEDDESFIWADSYNRHQSFSEKGRVVPDYLLYDKEEAVWQAMYGRLVRFLLMHGHCLVPTSYEHPMHSRSIEEERSQSLSQWVAEQRRLKRQNRLKSIRNKLLDQIGFWLHSTVPKQLIETTEGNTPQASSDTECLLGMSTPPSMKTSSKNAVVTPMEEEERHLSRRRRRIASSRETPSQHPPVIGDSEQQREGLVDAYLMI